MQVVLVTEVTDGFTVCEIIKLWSVTWTMISTKGGKNCKKAHTKKNKQ